MLLWVCPCRIIGLTARLWSSMASCSRPSRRLPVLGSINLADRAAEGKSRRDQSIVAFRRGARTARSSISFRLGRARLRRTDASKCVSGCPSTVNSAFGSGHVHRIGTSDSGYSSYGRFMLITMPMPSNAAECELAAESTPKFGVPIVDQLHGVDIDAEPFADIARSSSWPGRLDRKASRLLRRCGPPDLPNLEEYSRGAPLVIRGTFEARCRELSLRLASRLRLLLKPFQSDIAMRGP